jgi:uncharacterized membrane protein
MCRAFRPARLAIRSVLPEVIGLYLFGPIGSLGTSHHLVNQGGIQIYQYILQRIGFAVCHQIPARVISIGGVYLPVCARDTGLYLGFFGSFMFLWAVDRGKRANELPSKGVMAVVFVAIGSLVFDGISSYLGFRETTNTIRLVTGLVTGFGLPLFLFPIFNYQIWKKSSEKPVLPELWERIGLLGTVIFTFLLIQLFQIMNVPFGAVILSTLAAVSVIFTFSVINLILVTLIPFWYQRAENTLQLAIPIVLSVAFAAVELFFSGYLHQYLISLTI